MRGYTLGVTPAMAQVHEASTSSSSSLRDNSINNSNGNTNPNLYQAASPIPIPTATTTTPNTKTISQAIMQNEQYYKQQVKQVRELWMLREQARVQAVERKFLSRLHQLVERAAKRSHGLNGQDHMSHLRDAASRSASEHEQTVSSFLLNDSSWIFEQNRNANGSGNGNGANEEDEVDGDSQQNQHEGQNQNPWSALLEEEQYVTHALESEFRHQLERVLVERRSSVEQGRRVHPYYQRLHEANQIHSVIREEDDYERQFQALEQGTQGHDSSVSSGAAESSGIRSLERAVLELRYEIGVLKNVINASFDVQLDIQRSIRQELAAAMYTYSMNKSGCPSVTLTSRPVRNQPRQRGCCAICIDTSIDCVLYMCGHYCICSSCARSLLSSGLPCPICRAPIRDVIQIYDTMEDPGAGVSGLDDNLSTSLASPGMSL